MTLPTPAPSAGPPPGPIPPVVLPAWVAPGVPAVLCAPGFGGQFMADFNRDQHGDATSDLDVRLLRPGLIVLPNLDIDDPARLPAPRPADVTGLLDASDATTNGALDEAGLSR